MDEKTDGKIWDPNPERLCGSKHPGYYVESGGTSVNGSLSLVTLCTGDLLASGENILCQIPPRGSHIFYPIDTFRLGEVCFDGAAAHTPDSRKEIERIVTNGTKALGIVDHVGSNHYSPVSFINELHELGASRRVTAEMAQGVVTLMRRGFTSIPIFFSHSQIPLLSGKEWDEATDLVSTGFDIDTYLDTMDDPYQNLFLGASYTHPTWGMRRQKWGGLWEEVPAAAWYILKLADAATSDDGNGRYAAAKQLFDECIYREQLLCASWIKQVTYVTDNGQVPKWVEESGVVSVLEIEPIEEE